MFLPIQNNAITNFLVHFVLKLTLAWRHDKNQAKSTYNCAYMYDFLVVIILKLPYVTMDGSLCSGEQKFPNTSCVIETHIEFG